jgi:hypothetical protein
MTTSLDVTGAALPGANGARAEGLLPQPGPAPAQQGPVAVQGKPGPTAGSGRKAAGDTVQLSPQASALVAKLAARDADVRAHEAAHVAAGGSLITGGPNFSYQRGPDGRDYAVGGDVTIDTSAVPGDPAATAAKARQVEAAALAPADPSGQDESVAGQAEAMAAQASAQVAASRGAPGGGKGGRASAPGSLVDVTA